MGLLSRLRGGAARERPVADVPLAVRVGAGALLVAQVTLSALQPEPAASAQALPEVPALAESVPGYVVTGWLGLGVPKGTPSAIVERLNREMNAVLADPEVITRLTNVGSVPFSGSPADFGTFLAAEADKWGKVVKFSGIKAN